MLILQKKKDDDQLNIAVGGYGQKRLAADPKNTIYDTKRMLAQQYEDENIQKMIPKWPFSIEKTKKVGFQFV